MRGLPSVSCPASSTAARLPGISVDQVPDYLGERGPRPCCSFDVQLNGLKVKQLGAADLHARDVAIAAHVAMVPDLESYALAACKFPAGCMMNPEGSGRSARRPGPGTSPRSRRRGGRDRPAVHPGDHRGCPDDHRPHHGTGSPPLGALRGSQPLRKTMPRPVEDLAGHRRQSTCGQVRSSQSRSCRHCVGWMSRSFRSSGTTHRTSLASSFTVGVPLTGLPSRISSHSWRISPSV